jgi:hypothetical protein
MAGLAAVSDNSSEVILAAQRVAQAIDDGGRGDAFFLSGEPPDAVLHFPKFVQHVRRIHGDRPSSRDLALVFTAADFRQQDTATVRSLRLQVGRKRQEHKQSQSSRCWRPPVTGVASRGDATAAHVSSHHHQTAAGARSGVGKLRRHGPVRSVVTSRPSRRPAKSVSSGEVLPAQALAQARTSSVAAPQHTTVRRSRHGCGCCGSRPAATKEAAVASRRPPSSTSAHGKSCDIHAQPRPPQLSSSSQMEPEELTQLLTVAELEPEPEPEPEPELGLGLESSTLTPVAAKLQSVTELTHGSRQSRQGGSAQSAVVSVSQQHPVSTRTRTRTSSTDGQTVDAVADQLSRLHAEFHTQLAEEQRRVDRLVRADILESAALHHRQPHTWTAAPQAAAAAAAAAPQLDLGASPSGSVAQQLATMHTQFVRSSSQLERRERWSEAGSRARLQQPHRQLTFSPPGRHRWLP